MCPGKEPKEEKAKHELSAYNQFMKDRLPAFKVANPNMNHQEVFKGVSPMSHKSVFLPPIHLRRVPFCDVPDSAPFVLLCVISRSVYV